MTVTRTDLHLSATDRKRIARAAALRGVLVADFMREAVLSAADTVMASEAVTLSTEESRRFLEALDVSFQPNARLKQALARITRDSTAPLG